MKSPSDDWDAEERDALKSLEGELAAIRARHAGDPPLDLLRAASGDALPAELQASVSQHLADSAWSRALVEGADAVEVSLTADDQQRLLARIRDARDQMPARSWWSRLWIPALATAATVVLVVLLVRRGDRSPKSEEAPRAAAPSVPTSVPPPTAAAPSPRFILALSKPDVKLSPSALTYRGAAGSNGFLIDMKPALDAFRESNYARADREFSTLESRYPQSVEIRFYQGVARIFLNDVAGADAALAAAERVNDASFAGDVAWYRAIVDERAGRAAAARTRLDALCRDASSVRRSQACDAASRLK